MTSKADKKRKYTNTKPMAMTRQFRPGFLERLDKRSQVFAELKGTFDEILADQGGADQVSTVRRTLIERFAFARTAINIVEQELIADAVAGKPLDIDKLRGWSFANNSLKGLAKHLGLGRKRKAVSLETYVKQKATSNE